MQGSASAPTLGTDSYDYTLPGAHGNGVGNSSFAKKVLLGPAEKDDGKHSSRINQIVKQAGKVPGPGKYVAHTDWKHEKATKFPNGVRGYRTMHLNPPPNHYEAKDFTTMKTNGSRTTQSKCPKALYGKIGPEGKPWSFLDQSTKLGAKSPGAGAYNPTLVCAKKGGVTSWDKEKSKSTTKKVKVADIAPNHYKISYASQEANPPQYSVPKDPERR